MTALKKSLYAILLASFGAGSFLTAEAADEFPMQTYTGLPPKVTVLRRSESVLGKTLIGASGESAGRIVDVLADPAGQVRAAVIEFGGFLGVGSRRIAVDWSDLRFEASRVSVDLTLERLSRAPEVKEGAPVYAISARSIRDRAELSSP
jgi:hypothetical protein